MHGEPPELLGCQLSKDEPTLPAASTPASEVWTDSTAPVAVGSPVVFVESTPTTSRWTSSEAGPYLHGVFDAELVHGVPRHVWLVLVSAHLSVTWIVVGPAGAVIAPPELV